MHPTLQLLTRLESELSESSIHWFDIPERSTLVKDSDRFFSLDYVSGNSAPENLIAWPTTDLNILFYPKAKDRLFWWLKQLQSELSTNQRLWVIGENNGGIKSLPNKLKGLFTCTKIDSARHCALYELEQIEPLVANVQWLEYETHDIQVMSLPGVFSANRLDKGTQVLFSALPEISGSVLEFGGGAGVITTSVAKMPKVKNVVSCEIDLLAVHSSRKTFEVNNLGDKASVIWSDGLTLVPNHKFDVIITNPPFHKGVKTSYTASELFFTQAADWLKPRGQLIWVANEFLNYQLLLEKKLSSVTVLAHEKGFKVYKAVL